MSARLEHPKQPAARGVGRFLWVHERCGHGFAITRNGTGRLKLLCEGCGEASGYGAMDTEELRAHGVDLTEMTAGPRFRPSAETVGRWLPSPPALPWWVPNAYIIGVILIGAVLIAFGVLAPRDSDDPTPSEGPTATAPSPSTPPAPAGSAPAPATAGALGAGAPERQPQRRPARRPKPDLDRMVVLGRFAIGVPEGWGRGTSRGAVVLQAPSLNARVRVFLEAGATRPGNLRRQAAEFLAREHSGARIRRKAGGLGGRRAVRLVVKHEEGKQWAAVLTAGGYTYFLVADAEDDASGEDRAAAVASLRSFRPR